MVVYNVTITIDKPLADGWKKWMTESHIPDVMSTGMFLSYRLSRLLDHEHEDAEIFTTQYLAKDMATLLRYNRDFAPALQKEHAERFAGRYSAFRTVMEVVDHNEKM